MLKVSLEIYIIFVSIHAKSLPNLFDVIALLLA